MKSDVSNLLELVENIYIDATTMCIAEVSDNRDLLTIRSRVEHEGLSFLTITLPNFCKDFERSLEIGEIDSTSFQGFRKLGSIPAFLQGMISQMFNMEDGKYEPPNDATSSSIIECVRQICLSFKKLELPCTPKRVQETFLGLVQTETDLNEFPVLDEDANTFVRFSHLLWDNLVATFCLSDCIPDHGPGGTAERISGNGKYVWRYWHERLEPYFPFIDNAYNLSALPSRDLEKVTFLPESEEIPVRIIPVPKTLKSPRIIAIEPVCMQYVQHGIQNEIHKRISSDRLTRGHLNFVDQSINRSLALSSSSDGQFCTIDLSEASDRVPHDLALRMFDANPDFRDAIDACRSTAAVFPDGTLMSPLKKFAMMGSALCFPIESMYFYTICVMTLMQENNLPFTLQGALMASRKVFVYGDDIIVPTDNAIAVFNNLTKYKCKVNTNKTFVTGKFRESCGLDAYAGYEVTPTYIRRMPPRDRHDGQSIISWIATANLFYKRGYWRTTSYMLKQCEKHIGSLPYVQEGSAGLGRSSFQNYRSFERWNDSYQRQEIRCWVPEAVYRTGKLEDYPALQKSLSRLENLKDLYEPRDKKHLERYARHGVVALKRRWVPAHY